MYTKTPTQRTPGALNAYMGMSGLITGMGAAVVGFDPLSLGISAGVGFATTALSSWLADKRANAMAKTYSTTIVNDLEPLLRANTNAYLASARTCADQAAALTAFDSAMQWLQSPQACGNMQLGTAGQNCINDRLPGGQWDWYAMYRNPIANDPMPQCNTTADSASQAAVANIISKISGSNVQTNAQQYSTPTGTTAGATDTTSGLLPATVGGIPTGYVLMGAGAILLIALIS